MQLAKVIGHATATIKHSSMNGWRLVIVQPLGVGDKPDGEPIIAICNQGCGRGDRVMITSDGKGVRAMIGSDTSPVRWAVIGVLDPEKDE